MAVQGPEVRAKYTLNIADALKGITKLSTEIEANERRQVGANKKTRQAVRDTNRVLKAQQATKRAIIAQTKEQIRVLDRATAAQKKQTAATKQATHSFGTFSKALGTSITLWYTARTAIFAVQRALEGLLGVYVKGVEKIDDFRLSVIGTSAIMIPSIESGTTAAEKMAIAWEHNTNMMLKLEVVAARHIATGKALQDVYEGMIIARVFPDDKDVENLAKLADFITLYTKGQRLEIQLMQEVRGLMDGQVRAQNKLAYTLDRILNGKLKEHIQLWRAAGRDSSGQLVILKEITRLLGDIGILQGEILGTAQTWKNTLETITTRILREGTVKAYEDITNALKASVGFLFDINAGYTEQAEILIRILEEGWLRIRSAVKGFLRMEMEELDEAMTKLLKSTLTWLVDADKKADALGKKLRLVFDGILAIIKNIETALYFIIASRIPSWIVKIGLVLKSMIFVAEVTTTVVAGWVGLAAGLLVLVTRSEKLAKWWGRIGEKVREADEALERYIDRSKGDIEYGKISTPKIMYGKIPKAPVSPKFSSNIKIAEEELKRIAKLQEQYEKKFDRIEKSRWAMYAEGVKDYSRHTSQSLKDREREEEAYIKRMEDREDGRIKLYIEGERDHQRAIRERMAEAAKTEKDILDLRIGLYTGYYRQVLDIENKIAEEKNKIAEAQRKNDFAAEKRHTEKKKLLEKTLTKAKTDMYMNSASIAAGAAAESFRMIAEHNKKWFKWYQGFAIAEIAINTAIAMMRAYSELGPIAGSVAAGFIAALGAVQAASVLAQSPPEELAEGGVSPTGFSGLQGVYGQPTYMIAEKQGKPEAVVPLDKYVVSEKGDERQSGGDINVYIMAQDAKSFRDFARRNKGTFGEQIISLVEDNNPRLKAAIKTAAR